MDDKRKDKLGIDDELMAEIIAAKKRLDEGIARYIDADEYKKWKGRKRKQPIYLLFNKEED